MAARSLVARARWKLAHALWPERLRPNKLVTRWRLRASEAEAVARWLAAGGESTGRHRPEARSQNGEDSLLWDLLGDRERGFFVEAGAYDGYTFSVSYLFEGAGWDGLLVEPLSDRAAECAERRSARVVNAALSAPDAPPTAAFARDPEIEWNSGLASGGQGGETVPVTTLDALLEGHSGPIDFVVLDLEGHELSALEGFDLERWRPTALLVEENDVTRERLRSHFEEHGYVYGLSLGPNFLFVRGDEADLLARLGSRWEDTGLLADPSSNGQPPQRGDSPHERLRAELLRERNVGVVLDVGANEGSFGVELRSEGYGGRIVSFEPLTRVFGKLEARAKPDPLWESRRVALGSKNGTATLNVAGNWASSSLLPMNNRHWAAEPRSAYVDEEECEVVTLDSLATDLVEPGAHVFLKLDVQGSELDVLRGAAATLESVEVIQAELSLVPLYDGAPLLGSVVRHLDENGFALVGLAPAFVHPKTRAILQVDGIFARIRD